MIIMQKNLVSLICTLALLAFLMPATIAEDSQNVAAMIPLNESLNVTANITLNETQNVTANISLNETQNVTANIMPVDNLNFAEDLSENVRQESAPVLSLVGAGNASMHS